MSLCSGPFKSSVSWQATSGQSCGFDQCRVGLHGYEGDGHETITLDPRLEASEEEHKVNVDRAKRVFTANTLSTPTRHGAAPETTATSEEGMAPEDDHQRPGFCMRAKLRKQVPTETWRTL